MKEIKAIIQPSMFEPVLDALEENCELPGMTVSEVIGRGDSPADQAGEVTWEGHHTFVKKTKIEIVLTDSERVLETRRFRRIGGVDTIGDSPLTGVNRHGRVRRNNARKQYAVLRVQIHVAATSIDNRAVGHRDRQPGI